MCCATGASFFLFCLGLQFIYATPIRPNREPFVLCADQEMVSIRIPVLVGKYTHMEGAAAYLLTSSLCIQSTTSRVSRIFTVPNES